MTTSRVYSGSSRGQHITTIQRWRRANGIGMFRACAVARERCITNEVELRKFSPQNLRNINVWEASLAMFKDVHPKFILQKMWLYT